MNIEKYVSGKGVDASLNKEIDNAKYFPKIPDNFYTLKEIADYESLDFVYSKNFINITKFHKILLKEWFNFLRVGGNMIIEMISNDILLFEELTKNLDLLFGDKIKIVIKKKNHSGGIICIKKDKSSLKKNDFVDRWTFGILTDGTKENVLNKQINSILALKIPKHEIIICGNCKKIKKRKGVRYIHFHPGVAWITKQKNIICKNAKYENIVIAHNRFNFDKNWYNGMKKYGNYFDVLVCKIHDPLGRRAGDWLTYGRPIEDRWINQIGLLDYSDWDENGIINGSFYILKKSTWRRCPWDEKRVWGQSEDDFLSLSFRDNGIIPRFNPYSTVYTFPDRYGEWHWKYEFDSKKLGKARTNSAKKYILRLIDRFLRKHFNVGFVRRANVNTYGW